MTITFEYYIVFGKCDCSEPMDYEIELTPEEEAAYLQAQKDGTPFDEVPELGDAWDRAYDEIQEMERENAEELYGEDNEADTWDLHVDFPENDFDEDDVDYDDDEEEE